MTFGKSQLACVSLVCAATFFNSFAQSGRTPSTPPSATATPDSKPSNPGVAVRTPANSARKYQIVFSTDGTFGNFIDQLNRGSEAGYRLKSVVHGWQSFSGKPYLVPVAVLQPDEIEFEYAWFEVTSSLFFAIPDLEREFAAQSKKGFRFVDFFRSSTSCEEYDADTVVPIPRCESTYRFLLEREKGAPTPKKFFVAEQMPDWKRNPGPALASVIIEKLASGFYPVEVLTNNQILLAQADEKDEWDNETPEVQIITSSFLNGVKKKINKLGQEGFRLALLGDECALMYRRRDEREPVVYEWLSAKNKKLETELAKLQETGAVFRMVYRDPGGGNQLVFERAPSGGNRSLEYKVMKLNFQVIDRATPQPGANVKLDLAPEAKETVKLINQLASKGFVVRDLFVSDIVSNGVGLLLERSR